MEEKTRRILNRTHGLTFIVFGGIIMTGDHVLSDLGGAMFLIEGLGDFISGDHHYTSSKIIKYLSRRKINIEHESNRYQ